MKSPVRRRSGPVANADHRADAAPLDEDTSAPQDDDHDGQAHSGLGEGTARPDGGRPRPRRQRGLKRIVVFGLLPAIAMALTVGAAALKWRSATLASNEAAAGASVQAATDGTVAILSYRPDTVDQDLGAARSRLTGSFLDAYASLTHDVVIPGAKQKKITATARVPAAASVSAGGDHAVVLVLVDQTTTVGADPPTDTSSTVRVTLDKHGDQWLISAFDPI